MGANIDYISIHALREEGDKSIPGNGLPYQNFNPRPPRGGRLGGCGAVVCLSVISIHALREEGDVPVEVAFRGILRISIHALREEGDSKSGEKIHHVCSIIHTCAQFEKELYEGSGEMQNKSC